MIRPEIPQGYEQRLKDIDRGLSFVWDQKRSRWEIWWKNPQGKNTRCLIVGDGYRYKALDGEVFQTLERGDTHKIGLKAVIREIEQAEDEFERQKEKARESLADDIARDAASIGRLTQKPIGVATEKEWKKSKGGILVPTSTPSN